MPAMSNPDPLQQDPQATTADPAQTGGAPLNLIDPKLRERALKRVRSLVKGNGIKAEDVSLESCEALVYPFGARTFVRLSPVYGIRTEPGQNKTAELATSQEDFNHKLQSSVQAARTEPDKRKIIVDFIFARNDKGFGVKDQKVKFDALTRDYVTHEGCVSCARNGRVQCQSCHAKGMVACSLCQSREVIVCPQCRGSGRTPGSSAHHSCTKCRGDGKIQCTQCNGRGQMKCPKCAAKGSLQCQKCAGSGWLSNLAHVEIEAQLHFDFDRTAVPGDVARYLDAFGSRLIQRGDTEVRLYPPQPTTAEEIARKGEPQDMIFIDYAAKIPFGALRFRLKDHVIATTLFGYQGRLIEAPSFLDDLTRKGQEALVEAAKGTGDVGDKIRRAARYRLLRDVILQAAQGVRQRDALELLTARYPTGIGADKLLSLFIYADKSLKIITRKPRSIGLGVGIGVFAAIASFYALLGGRSLTGATGVPEIGLAAMDALLIPFGTLLSVFMAQAFALKAQRGALEGLASKVALGRTAPRAGKTLWWALGLSALITLAVFAANYGGIAGVQPVWMEKLAQMIGPAS